MLSDEEFLEELRNMPAPAKPKRRRIVQVAHSTAVDVSDRYETTVALCDDGTVWIIQDGHQWFRMLAIPQDEEVTVTGVRDESEEG